MNKQELGLYISEKAKNHFSKWYSDDINDYINDIRLDDANDKYECYHIELTETNKQPLIIKFIYNLKKDIFIID